MLITYEDKRFFAHGGVDPQALLRAAWQAATHRRIVSGGSTLTMQVARLLEPRPERSLTDKLAEMVRALQIERRLTKQQILSLYLALAPYGGNIEGTRAAALAYFGKEPKRLSTAESALLVALPQAPQARRPDRFPKAASGARNRVIARLNKEIVQVINRPEVVELMLTQGEAWTSSPEAFAAFIKIEHDKWGRVIREQGITAN